MNNPCAVASLQTTLSLSPETAHRGTIAACLTYRAYPLPTDPITSRSQRAQDDEEFFLTEAMNGDNEWYGKLMADHTALDWRASIKATFGRDSGSSTKVLVVASTRSGCFPAEGPLHVVDLVGERAKGVAVDWGGHWCYWEDADRFNSLCLGFLAD
jgi:pimeloyl-ACP methyl ester carboxylesterase